MLPSFSGTVAELSCRSWQLTSCEPTSICANGGMSWGLMRRHRHAVGHLFETVSVAGGYSSPLHGRELLMQIMGADTQS